jgi:hypothetical protein
MILPHDANPGRIEFSETTGALLSSFFYFDTGAYKLVDLIWDKQVTLAELSYIS